MGTEAVVLLDVARKGYRSGKELETSAHLGSRQHSLVGVKFGLYHEFYEEAFI